MTMKNFDQLTLGIELDDDARFENFHTSGENQQVLDALQAEQSEQFIFLWGSGSPGLTHLLQAACHQASLENKSAMYLPLKEKNHFSVEILDGAAALSLLCIDDLDAVVGDENWEAALFTAFNSLRESQGRLIVAGKTSAQNIQIVLPDLLSRLQSGLTLQVKELSDSEKLLALQARAKQRGIAMSDSVAEFILLRAERSLPALMLILDQLDKGSLEQKRKLTIPLVKSILDW